MASIYLSIYISIYISLYIYIHIHIYIHTYISIHISVFLVKQYPQYQPRNGQKALPRASAQGGFSAKDELLRKGFRVYRV